ncbi:class I SAM-dependent methyltransferase [Saccharopolyspora sp. NFXS83]|uniref:class I SAM-dependent methyltransferase n=1 Tax=Saccharopolyspora sp. NFXS83 TaxID=2993560 RepID=UPI00224B37E7|nr:class I SAM-dependent methyltransferase [Saccharopolyspora sp. NFXS83]MCX2729190.1 class I SAM-dependent methyltransferase [Saccharopolyspora sp. NFXS83]
MKITLTGAAETLLAPLFARAVDAQSDDPLLGDTAAAEIVRELDYDFSRLRVQQATAVGVALRTRFFDRCTKNFLGDHPEATVLNLGCGLDTRGQRIAPGPGVNWFDVDQAEVIELRSQLFDVPAGHRSIAASVTETGWLSEVPTDLPVLVVAEGLSMYLPADEGPRMLRDIVAHFRGGEVVFDSYSRFAVRMTRPLPVFRETGARLAWGINDPREVVRAVPELRLISAIGAHHTAERADRERLPTALRRRLWFDVQVMGRLPIMRNIGHLSRFSFGE